MVYMYIVKHNYILGSMFTNTKAQLHVSAINVGHLQVVHEKFINKLYQCVWGAYRLWDGVGTRSLLCWSRGRGLRLFRDRVKVTSMSTYSYVQKCTMVFDVSVTVHHIYK